MLYRNDTGNIVGKGADVRPCAVAAMKSVKFPIMFKEAHPPVESLKSPLMGALETKNREEEERRLRVHSCRANE